MHDRHAINQKLIYELDEFEVMRIYESVAGDYPDLNYGNDLNQQNEIQKRMVHDYMDCWAVDWGDGLDVYSKLTKIIGFTEEEIREHIEIMYQQANNLGLPCSARGYKNAESDDAWLSPEDSQEFLDAPIRIYRHEGEPVFACYAHEVCWFLTERWLDHTISMVGSCEQEVKYLLHELAMNSTEEVYTRDKCFFFFSLTALLVSGVITGLVGMLSGQVLPTLSLGVFFIFTLAVFIWSAKELTYVSIRKFAVKPSENEDMTIPKAAELIRQKK